MAGWVVTVTTGVPVAVMSLVALYRMNQLHAWYFDRPDGWIPGPRLAWPVQRRAFHAMGTWLITLAGFMLATAIQRHDVASGNFATPLGVGLGMRFLPGIFAGSAAVDALFSKHDYKQPAGPFLPEPQYDRPIGPEPDPTPWLRSAEALERWLDELDEPV